MERYPYKIILPNLELENPLMITKKTIDIYQMKVYKRKAAIFKKIVNHKLLLVPTGAKKIIYMRKKLIIDLGVDEFIGYDWVYDIIYKKVPFYWTEQYLTIYPDKKNLGVMVEDAED